MLKKLGKDVAIYGAGDLVFKLIAFAVFPIYAHHFSVADFGVLSLLTVTAALVGVFINLGVNNSVQRYYFDPETSKEQQPVFVSTGLAQLVITGVVFILLLLFSLYWTRDLIWNRYGIEWKIIVIVAGTVLIDQVLQFSLDAVRLHFNPVHFLIISFSKNLLGVCIGLFFILVLNKGLYGYFLGLLVGSAFAVPLAIWFIRQDLTLKFNKDVARKLFRFGFPFVFAAIAYWVFGSLDRWMLAELSSISEVGLYSIAFKFAAVIGFVNTAFGQAWSPHAFKLMRDDVNYRAVYSKIFSLWFFGLSVIGLFVSLYAKEALMLLTPPSYWGASNILALVTAATVLYGTTQITALGITLEKKTRLLTVGAFIAAIANLVLNFILIPLLGGLGAAIATLVSFAVLTSTFLYFTQRLHPIPLEKNKLFYCCFIVFISVLLPAYIHTSEVSAGIMALKMMVILIAIAGGFLSQIVDRSLLRRVFTIKKFNAKGSYYRL